MEPAAPAYGTGTDCLPSLRGLYVSIPSAMRLVLQAEDEALIFRVSITHLTRYIMLAITESFSFGSPSDKWKERADPQWCLRREKKIRLVRYTLHVWKLTRNLELQRVCPSNIRSGVIGARQIEGFTVDCASKQTSFEGFRPIRFHMFL